MNVATDAPKRPVFQYHGGKWRLAPWIITHFPPHKTYVEPCGGAASVLLSKEKTPLEVYNDLDGHIVNFFRVLRDTPHELIRRIKLTPYARDEYELARQNSDYGIEGARCFFISCWMAISKMAYSDSGMSTQSYAGQNYTPNAELMRNAESELMIVSNRLRNVQIENRQAYQIIKRHNYPKTLIYFDPPYVKSERSAKNNYIVDAGDDLHIESAELLRRSVGFVVVSGYACPLYTELYEDHGWHRVDKEAQTNSGGKRIESLWISPRTWRALHDDMSDLPLFKTNEVDDAS